MAVNVALYFPSAYSSISTTGAVLAPNKNHMLKINQSRINTNNNNQSRINTDNNNQSRINTNNNNQARINTNNNNQYQLSVATLDVS